MAIDSPVYVAAGLTCLLGKIRSYESLGPLTHRSGIPAPFITHEQCVDVETDIPLTQANATQLVKRAADFRRRYDQLAWNILKLMNSDPGGRCYGHLDWALLDRREWAGGPTRADDGCPHVQNAQPGY
ncbi:unnamed protein product [Ectocarpus sp. CCAP 1310/34]|nr:unnamed protein product [Ectocarpus sp. CCAP 1310/34]